MSWALCKLRRCRGDWIEVMRRYPKVNELGYVKVSRIVRRLDISAEKTSESE